MSLLWGIDLGGTKMEGVVIDPDRGPGDPLCRPRLLTEREKGYEHILSQLKRLIDQMILESGATPNLIGIGTPGAVDPETGELKNSNTVCLNGKPFRADLERALNLPLVMANDANCFALAESRWGAAQDAAVVFGVILGTGVGGGLVVNGKPIQGLHGIAGEWGHNMLDATGEVCYCGKRGCVETVISGPSLARYFHELTGSQLTFEEIARIDSPEARMTHQRLESQFGIAIAPIINILDPDVIVLGGGVGSAPGLAERASEHALPNVFNHVVRTRFVRPKYGASAGVFGAALLTA